MWHHDRTMPRTMPRVFILAVVAALVSVRAFAQDAPPTLLISGNIVTPDGMLPHAWLEIANHHILHIEKEKPSLPAALVLETNDLIFPGFIDLHNQSKLQHPAALDASTKIPQPLCVA